MPYKNVDYILHCPKCNMDYIVKAQSYFRKKKDPKYGMLCKSCRAKVQYEEMSDEEKILKNNASSERMKKRWESLSDEQKESEKQKRSNGTKQMWKNMSDNERKKISEKRSRDRKAFVESLSDDKRLEIGKNISKSKFERFESMSDEERESYKKLRQEERKRYWDSLSDERKDEICNILKYNSRDYWDNITEEEMDIRRKRTSEMRKKLWDEMNQEDKDSYFKSLYESGREWFKNMTDTERSEYGRKISEGLIGYWGSLSDEQIDTIRRQRSETFRSRLNAMTPEEYKQYTEMLSDNMKSYWDSLDEETRAKRQDINRNMWKNLPDDVKERIRKESSERWASYTTEEREGIRQRQYESYKRYYDNLSDDDRAMISQRSKDVWKQLTDDEKTERLTGLRNWRNNMTAEEWQVEVDKQHQWIKEMTPEQRSEFNKKIYSHDKNHTTSLNVRFEEMFNASYLINDYYYEVEKTLTGDILHSWDYAIYSRKNNELVMVVDLDGAYYHADMCDYDGIHSKEEYDERRILSIPSNMNIKYFIIQEKIFNKSFELMVETLISNYDNFIDNIFKYCRSMPFPFPRYSNIELRKSLNNLKNMDCSDKYHKSISLNTRAGDRIIQHFHESIYHANRKGKVSPYDAWYNDELLKKCIKNRVIYQTYLNPNKILQGFNVSRIAQRVSVFSAGRAKMLISKYLNECDEIFDPFSGFSGRMLGAISLGKKYIGQDISPIHVRESNEIIKYFNFKNASVSQCDILQSSGEYECLFTCPPYEDIEQWQDVKPDKRTCDDWIDECISRFKCRKYLFVVDYTDKYVSNVVDVITNKSHINRNSEYVILIQK